MPPPKNPAAERFSARIGYYPLSGAVVGILEGPPPPDADRAALRVEGLPEQRLAFSPQTQGSERRLLTVPLAKGSQPARTAELSVWQDTNCIQTVRRNLPAVTAPDWLGTDAGAAYAHDAIPKPWVRPTVTKQSVFLCNTTLHAGAFGLFDSVVSTGGELLAGPASIEVGVNGRTLPLHPAQPRVVRDGNGVRIEALAHADGAAVETRARIEYDGFTEVKLRVSGVTPASLTRLRVRIPLRKELANIVLRELTQRVTALDGYGFEGPAGPLWVGNETHGLAFAAAGGFVH